MKKYMGLDDMSKVNCSNVLSVIREEKEVSRRVISDITGLSWGGMTKIVNKLFEKGYIEEIRKSSGAGAGRIPGVITICKEKNVVIGLDINREGLRACVLNLAGDVIKEYSKDINATSKETLIQGILAFIASVVKENNKRKILAIGVAMQGIINVDTGISEKFPECLGWENVPIREILIRHFQYPVFIEHDPNCMLYSSIYNNPEENCILFRMDRSIGMAASVGGRIIRGNGLLEIAHSIIVPGGKLCKCGRRGCAESYLASCLVDKKIQADATQEMVKVIPVLMYNMVQVFNATKLILTGELIPYKSVFEKELLKEFYSLEGVEQVKVEFMEETRKAMYGAAMIAIQRAIEEIEI